MKKNKYLEKALSWVEKRSTVSVNSIAKDYEDPKAFISKSSKEKIRADISFVTHGGAKHFTEIALKNMDTKKQVVKWKVLSFIAGVKRGKLHLLAPKGHKAYTERLVKRYNINAMVYSL